MHRRAYQAPALVAALILTLFLAACGEGGTSVGGGNEAPKTGAGTRQATAFDPRDEPIGCFAGKGVQSEKDPRYRERINILPATSGAYVTFTATLQDALSRQLRNEDDATGAEAIGPALFTVGDLDDATLGKIEDCLDERGTKY
ncbi:hypothetical protein Q5424_03715 [Conexibacter sp. JD483]|uniref:hypothetical protein n=1 Tax=unclassified Conexibacter TaxID=2627773 RepID=UPI0027248D0D|nr:MULTISPECIES: hypothetical protein [unclassified Conexibacter]MDO8186197.1 hypothetical protein [Conexibacter sp. CPCC 205706]MDO8199736.1 hypothetical protein [Conexibacter sp. CPCC 205762]MDR9368172.1 hypothetical protein [Conexibacter sp. JD483]